MRQPGSLYQHLDYDQGRYQVQRAELMQGEVEVEQGQEGHHSRWLWLRWLWRLFSGGLAQGRELVGDLLHSKRMKRIGEPMPQQQREHLL